jgi:hypothetical protein
VEIDDIEVLDGGVDLSDEPLVTHEFVVGDTLNVGDSGLGNALASHGVVTVFNAFLSSSMLTKTRKTPKDGAGPLDKENDAGMDKLLQADDAIAFLERYGARPKREDIPAIKHPYYEMFLAYQRFMQAWARQFSTPFTFTFMPELYPGGKVGFPDHGLQMYIDEVTHIFDYTSGFMTQANLSSPSAYGNAEDQKGLPPHMVRASITAATKAKKKKTTKSSVEKRMSKAESAKALKVLEGVG